VWQRDGFQMTALGAPPVPGGGQRPRSAGKFIHVGGRKLMVRGVTYGSFRSGPLGVPYPDPSVVREDLLHMANAGFNAVRTYTVPPEWLLDEAAGAGLWVLVGIPWEQHVAFLDEPGLDRTIRARIHDGVLRCRGHQAILGYALGNEIAAPIVRWSGRRRIEAHLRRLYDTAKSVDPDALVTYANYPSTEYLDLPFLDVLAVNVFLESTLRLAAYLARLHSLAADRPLLVTEIGLDSLRHGQSQQARLLKEQVRAIEAGGCAGSFTFSWTDEWHRGGSDVEDWEFGLTTRDRRPKRALFALSEVFSRPGPDLEGRWPRISVVLCCYNAAATLADCLEGIEGLAYPDYEVIVVDDGSTDATAEIAARHDVRLIRTRNRGLSRARNTGIRQATGEIVAFIDSDARPDPDWLTQLALTFESSDFAGVGGPNIPPPGDGMVATCVAHSPGGPIHVLRTDREAEHVPGCNMAFRRSALLEIGGFDPRFRVAGDDVDVCWRIHARGWRIGFAPGAVVWHHARRTVRGYWRQQSGYGVAEALLEAKWPEKYNVAGHVTWGGRVYGPGTILFPFKRARVYRGTWGQAPFQQREEPTPNPLWEAAAMPEWYLVLGLLAVLSILGLAWKPLLLTLPLLLLGLGTTVTRAMLGAFRARFDGSPGRPWTLMAHRGLTAFLHLLQPLARLQGRWVQGLVPWRARTRTRRFLWPRSRLLRYWREEGREHALGLSRVEHELRQLGCVVRRDGGYDEWDLEVEGGALGAARLRSCEEWHEEGRQLLRFAIEPRPRGLAWVVVVVGGALGLWGLFDGATLVGLVLGGGALLTGLRALWEAGAAGAALVRAVPFAVHHEVGARFSAEVQAAEPATAGNRAAERHTWLPAAG
jgi:O-antigen biosynthesis protein